MMWYDGGKLPPEELFQGEKLITRDGGSLVIGCKGTLFTRTWHGGENEKDMFVLLPRKQFEGVPMPPPSLPRTRSHHQEWVDACRGQGKTLSHFGYASVLTESLLLGNVALRTGQPVEWDAAQMRVTNNKAADQFVRAGVQEGVDPLSRLIRSPFLHVFALGQSKVCHAAIKSSPTVSNFLAQFGVLCTLFCVLSGFPR